MINSKGIIVGLGLCALLGGCTWVPLSAAGSDVQVFPKADVVSCENKGKVTVTTKYEIAGILRGAEKVRIELITLARNQAPKMGGNVVSPLSEPKEGNQVFGVYHCPINQ